MAISIVSSIVGSVVESQISSLFGISSPSAGASATLAGVSSYNSSGTVAGPAVTTSALALGAVAASRVTWISISWKFFSGTHTLNTVTVGGVSATRVARNTNVASLYNTEIWVVASGTGSGLVAATTGAALLTFDAGNPSITMQIHRTTGLQATASSTSTGTNSGTITIPTGGGALFSFVNLGVGVGSLSNVTEDFNGASGTDFRGIHDSTLVPAGGSVTSTFSGTQSSPLMAVAALQP